MAQAPSQLKNLIAGKRPAEVYRVLLENQFLKRTDPDTRQEIIAIVKRATEAREPDPIPMPGPTSLDSLAGELFPFLNEKGADAYYSWPEEKPGFPDKRQSQPEEKPPARARPWWKWW
jgi:hypothetical protein